MGIAHHDACGDHVIGVLLQPSLSPAYLHQATGCSASAFALQTLSQSRVVVGFGNHALSRMERLLTPGRRRDRQVAHADIHPRDGRHGGWVWVSYLYLQGDEQVELLLGFVIPQLCRPELRAVLDQGDMLLVSGVGHDHAPAKRENAHLMVCFQAVIAMIVVGQRRGDELGRLIQPFVTLLRQAGLTRLGVLPGLRPQALVGGPHLARDVAGHLRRKPKPHPNLVVALALQPLLVAFLTMRERVARDVVQRVPVGEARLAQRAELLWCGQELQFGGQRHFHVNKCTMFHTKCQVAVGVNIPAPLPPRTRNTAFLPRHACLGLSCGGLLIHNL